MNYGYQDIKRVMAEASVSFKDAAASYEKGATTQVLRYTANGCFQNRRSLVRIVFGHN